MTIPTIFETCQPRPDVLSGRVSEADFAADLAQVIVGKGSPDYIDPQRFFANTYPTKGLRNLLANVCRRLSGQGGEVASIFRLDTSYGGGKSHGLIALCHAAGSGRRVQGIEEFVDPELLPEGPVRIAAFDGENADPANGRRMDDEGLLAYSPWGEMAFALAGKAGYERVRASDERRIAPGAETIRELFGGEPTLILLDELSVYLRKVRSLGKAAHQLTAFLTSLFKAVESTPNAVLVYTLAIGKDGQATDAYSEENQFIADRMAEAESVSGRMATPLNPTEEDETIQVLCRRLFEDISDEAANAAAESYRALWNAHQGALGSALKLPEAAGAFCASYPLHPEVLETLTEKTATLSNFQRVRGMLRLLVRTVAHLWAEKPADATAIHLHHMDLGHEPIRQEIVTRLGQSAFVPAITNDVAGQGGRVALAQQIDAEHHGGMPPYAAYVARTIFMHTLAFNDPLKGIAPERLRYSALGPETDISFIEEARKKFILESAYLDDRPGAPMRFLAEANLTQICRRMEDQVDAEAARAELNDRIREIFSGPTLDAVPFPGGPYDVADEVADGHPKLVVLGHEAVAIGATVEAPPELVRRIYERKGAEGSALRALRNNLVFVAADEARTGDMQRQTRRRLALRAMKQPDRLVELAEHQQAQVRELEARSEQELALAIQQCYRHVFYPSRLRIGASDADLAHTAIDTHSTSDRPGAGQQQIVRVLRELKKLRLAEDEPDSPAYVRDRTPLRKGEMTTLSLRGEFRRDPALPILVKDDIFRRGLRRGIEQGEYIYRSGKLLYGPGDPMADIQIDEQSAILTMAFAKNTGVWPRQPEAAEESEPAGDRLGVAEERSGFEARPGEDAPADTGRASESAPDSIEAEGVLREALVQLWERVRARNVASVGTLTIRLFQPSDAFKLLGAVGAVSSAERIVTIEGAYETRDGGAFEMKFRGAVQDAQPVREFLEPQLRDAKEADFCAGFELTFEAGISMQGDAPEMLTERLSRFTSGEAHLVATAKAG